MTSLLRNRCTTRLSFSGSLIFVDNAVRVLEVFMAMSLLRRCVWSISVMMMLYSMCACEGLSCGGPRMIPKLNPHSETRHTQHTHGEHTHTHTVNPCVYKHSGVFMKTKCYIMVFIYPSLISKDILLSSRALNAMKLCALNCDHFIQ